MIDIDTEESARNALTELDTQLQSALDDRRRLELLLAKVLCYAKLRRFDLAINILEDASRSVIEDSSLRLELEYMAGFIHHQAGNAAEAYKLLTAVLFKYSDELKQPNARFIYEDIQVQRGFDLVELDRFEEAIVLLEEVLAYKIRQDDRSAALAKLGLCYLNLKNYESAKKYLLQAAQHEQEPDLQGAIHFQLGIAYAQLKLFNESMRELLHCEENALKWNLPMQNVYGWLYRVCKRLGQNNRAEEYLRLSKQPD